MQSAVFVCHHCGAPLCGNQQKPSNYQQKAGRFCMVVLHDEAFWTWDPPTMRYKPDAAVHCLDCAKRYHGDSRGEYSKKIAALR
jgi:hypothetical protein